MRPRQWIAGRPDAGRAPLRGSDIDTAGSGDRGRRRLEVELGRTRQIRLLACDLHAAKFRGYRDDRRPLAQDLDHGKARPCQRPGWKAPRAHDRGAGQLPLRLWTLHEAGSHHRPRRRRRGRDRRRLRRRHHQRAGQPDGEAAVSLPQSAMRPDRRQRDREGRLPGRAYSCRGDKGRAAGRQDLHHSGIRWPCRNGIHSAAQSAVTRTGQGHAR